MAVKHIKMSKSKKRISYRNAYKKRTRTRRNKYRKSMRGGWGSLNIPHHQSKRKEPNNIFMMGGGWGMVLQNS